MTQTEQDVIKHYKQLYRDYGIQYYVYRLGSGKPIKFIKKEGFEAVFQTQIKPNFDIGAEYFHIQEFK